MKLKILLMLTCIGLVLTPAMSQIVASNDGAKKDSVNNNLEDLLDLSLEDMLNMEVAVTGTNKLSLRETPGIVTIITEQEIIASGARDLVDLLRTVPGFEFSGDIENTIAIGVRGNYSMEGKVLVMIDGQQISETGYGTVAWGNRFFTENVKKVEIIRGPGSAIYGGMAELAVINVITKSGEDMKGGYASTTYGNSNGSTSRVNGQFGVGTKLENGIDLSLSGGYSQANRSNESIDYATNYLDDEEGASSTFNYADSSQIKSMDINAGLQYKGLRVKGIFQQYDIEYNYDNADWLIFGGMYVGADYEWKVNDKLTITPMVSWKKEHPWSYKGNLSQDNLETYVAENYRSRGKVTGVYQATDAISVSFGSEFHQDQSVKPAGAFFNGTRKVSYSNIAGFAEALVKSKIANFVLGARYDNHSQFGDAFVPRFAVTKAYDKVHFKGLLSRAFKAPVVYNFEGNLDIKPEFTNVAEIEVGYLMNKNMSISANAFYINIDDPIIYYYDGITLEDGYLNQDKASTIGFELDYKMNYDWGFVNASYSYYRNNNTNSESYEVEDDASLLRGLPANKIVASSGINVGEKIVLAPRLIYNSKKVGYFYQEEWWEGYGANTFDPNLTINFLVNFKPINNLSLSAGVYDILGSNYITVSGYDSGYYGTPTMGREFTIKARYDFK